MSEVTAIRPNGKPYRRRKPPVAEDCEDSHYGESGVIVLRTHDLEEAQRLADGRLDEWVGLYPWHRAWMRLIPTMEAYGSSDYTWIDDPVRGVPVIIFGAWVIASDDQQRVGA